MKCEDCSPDFGCWNGSEPCRKRPLPRVSGYACACGSTKFERKIPMRGFWIMTIDTASGEAVGIESTTDGLEEVRQPVRMRCIQCGKTHPNFRRHNPEVKHDER